MYRGSASPTAIITNTMTTRRSVIQAETLHSYETNPQLNQQLIGCEARLAAQLFRLFLPIRLVVEPF